MRRLIFLVSALLALPAFAQRAPDIPRGTTEEAVIARYGWPKGKGMTDERENWLYETFQVTFESGRVVSVAYISPHTASAVRPRQTAPVALSSNSTSTTRNHVPSHPPASVNARNTPSPAVPAPVAVIRPRPSPTTYQSPTPVVRKDEPVLAIRQQAVPASLTSMAAETDPRRTPTARPPASASARLWYAPLFFGLLVIAATILTLRARARSLGDQLLDRKPEADAKRPAQRWEDHVADRLRAVNATPVAPPPINPAVLTLDLLRALEWKRFELIVQRYYSATGVGAELTGAGADGGIDIKLSHQGTGRAFCYVQCKAWGSTKVGVKLVRELLGVMAADKVEQGVLITTSDFWPDARAFAQTNGIAAIAGNDFLTMFAALPPATQASILADVTAGDYCTPSCPKCEVKAVSRVRGRDGVKFWSCRCGWKITARGAAGNS